MDWIANDPCALIYLGKTSEHMEMTQPLPWPTPWNPPALHYVRARATADPSREYLAISGELPLESWPGFDLRYQTTSERKTEVERRHAERYAADYALANGSSPWHAIGLGADPPDWICQVGTKEIGMDCVQFTIEAMRQVQDLVHKLKAAILGSDLSRLWHLSGHCVYFWVYDVAEDEMTLPPSSRKGQDVASLCEALATYQVDKSPSVEAGKPIPATIHVEFGKSSRGCVFYATPFNAGVPDSEFFRRTSFELGYVFPIWHTRPDALGILIKLVADHDQPGIDQLLVTVGGADRTGTRYVSDEALFLFLLDQPDLITLLPRHIKRVTAHLWSTGAIYELYPKFLCTSKGIPPPSRL